MKRSFGLLCLGALVAVISTSNAPKAQSVFWQSSFNCADWNQTKGVTAAQVACDGMRGHGAWTTSSGGVDQITAAANNPLGPGKGFRHFRGYGANNNGGGVEIGLGGLKEMWVRWYMRFEAGFSWVNLNYTKDLYFNVGAQPNFTAGFHWQDNFGIAAINPHSRALYGNVGWQSLNGGMVSDGRWHAYEIHVKMDTNGSNGIAETWIDGNQVHSARDVNWGTSGSWTHVLIGSNQAMTNNSRDFYTDYDDFVVSTSGYIGPLGGGGGSNSSSAPAAPSNLRITS